MLSEQGDDHAQVVVTLFIVRQDYSLPTTADSSRFGKLGGIIIVTGLWLLRQESPRAVG